MKRSLVPTILVVLAVVLAACGGGGGRPGAACTTNADCTQSFCNGSWAEGARCKKASDCPGYIEAAGGYRPPAPNKQCVHEICQQVGSCSNDHS